MNLGIGSGWDWPEIKKWLKFWYQYVSLSIYWLLISLPDYILNGPDLRLE